jgi:hypothetical protein
MASTVYKVKKLWDRFLKAARHAGPLKPPGGSGHRNEHVMVLQNSRKILPLLMREIENDNMCSELRQYYANVRVTTLNKPDKQDPTAEPKHFRPIG